jgi:predicted dehydrogenase
MIDAALVGLGWWGRTLERALARSRLLRPALGIDPSREAREAVRGIATSARFEDALECDDIAAVIIASPHACHAAQIVAAAKAGKHVFCEKPLCTTSAEMRAVAAAVTAAGVQLGVGHERRFEPGIIALRGRLAAGAFGTPLAMEGNFSQDKFLALPGDNWPPLGGGARWAARGDGHSPRRLGDRLLRQARGGLGAAGDPCQRLCQRRHARRDDRL